jgi:hypothetical protein
MIEHCCLPSVTIVQERSIYMLPLATRALQLPAVESASQIRIERLYVPTPSRLSHVDLCNKEPLQRSGMTLRFML